MASTVALQGLGEARAFRNELVPALQVRAVQLEVDVTSGDRFVLCSDGLSGVLSDAEIATIVREQPPEAAVDKLIEMANERGGPDNITVQILSVPISLADDAGETTAPVELSKAGISALERARRLREQMPRIRRVLFIIAVLIGIYLISQGLPEDTPTPAEEQPAAPAADRFEIESQPPRRGIPH